MSYKPLAFAVNDRTSIQKTLPINPVCKGRTSIQTHRTPTLEPPNTDPNPTVLQRKYDVLQINGILVNYTIINMFVAV
jgi:hypothetical protein